MRLAFLLALTLSHGLLCAAETDKDALLADILARAERARAAQPGVRLLACFDFDGTLLKGDCTEGLEENGRTVYEGITSECIRAGLSSLYPAADGAAAWRRDYEAMDRTEGPAKAYPFAVTCLAGAPVDAIESVARRHYEGRQRRHLYQVTSQLLRDLEHEGIECHVISASADLFVAASGPSLGLPRERIHGIVVGKDNQGRLTKDVLRLTTAEGKAAMVRELLDGGKGTAHVLAAFGNSWSTDGAMLRTAVESKLPGGVSGTAWIFNAGPRPSWAEGLEIKTGELRSVVGDK